MAAALKPEPCAEHPELVIYETTGGWPDDHSTEKGYCPTCGAWVKVTVFANGDIDYSPLTTAEISILKLNGQGMYE